MMRGSLRPVVAGLLLGMVLAVGASRLLRGVLYGLSAVDVVSFAGASLAVPDHRAGRELAAVPARDARRSTRRAQGSVICPPASHHVVRVAGCPR